jgi:hypothetical protein
MYGAQAAKGAGRGARWMRRTASIVKPREACSQSDPQYVIFSELLGERRQS